MKNNRPAGSIATTLAALILLVAMATAAAVEVRIDLFRPGEKRVRIAVPHFVSRSPYTKDNLGRQVAEIVAYDLDFSGYFQVLDSAQYPPDFLMLDPKPRRINFPRWRQVKARDLVHGLYTTRNGNVDIECRLFDVPEGRQIIGKAYRGERNLVRRIAHRFADEIVLAHTGRLGIAHTKIAFTSTSTGAKEIFVCDYDGENMRQLTRDRNIALSPNWSPDSTRISYTSYKDGNPDLYIMTADGSSSAMVSGVHGLNTAACWSPNGDTLALTLSKDGNAEIYIKEINSGRIRRLTHGRAIDTAPSFSPDGSHLAFVSDRSGSPQIWVMGLDGRNLRRISYQGGRSFTPDWSPLGDKIAYVVDVPGEGMQIFVMDADGSNPKQLTRGPGWNQEPTWSPNGTHIVFGSTRAGRSNIYTMRADDSEKPRRVTFLGGENGLPAWSN